MRARATPLLVLWACEAPVAPCDPPANLELVEELHAPEAEDTRGQAIEPGGQDRFELEGLVLDSDFPGGRLGAVERLDGGALSLHVSPESCPINDSAWYAFAITSATSQTVDLSLDFECGSHRYAPKVSLDRAAWQAVPETEPGRFSLDVGPETTWVAAQELVTSEDVRRWAEGFESASTIAESPGGRPILRVVLGRADGAAPWLAILGRQHPPEVTGQLALMAFVDRLAGDSALARRFREEHAVVVYPMINPDGVDRGHWRHNLFGVDLNRDWNELNQAETRSVRDDLTATTGERLAFAIDFHSTRSDLFYVSPEAPALEREWTCRVAARRPATQFRRQTLAATTPMATVWLATELGAPAVTYEVGDATDRTELAETAAAAADALMELLTDG